ncbi:MAG: hypothetical protein QHC67_15595 [Sphingobium sp.]|nr:hypothetical protein [Sphingobium sp.]MDX3911222.1 hypothetical protein [Sphingobium sp.]
MMNDEDQHDAGALTWVRERAGVIVGAVGLVAWVSLLWFMFGDVL